MRCTHAGLTNRIEVEQHVLQDVRRQCGEDCWRQVADAGRRQQLDGVPGLAVQSGATGSLQAVELDEQAARGCTLDGAAPAGVRAPRGLDSRASRHGGAALWLADNRRRSVMGGHHCHQMALSQLQKI